MIDHKLIAEIAERVVTRTNHMMILEYNHFESEIYRQFAHEIVKECLTPIIKLHNRVPTTVPAGYCAKTYQLACQDAISEIEEYFNLDIQTCEVPTE
jgi:hypothetical protein